MDLLFTFNSHQLRPPSPRPCLYLPCSLALARPPSRAKGYIAVNSIPVHRSEAHSALGRQSSGRQKESRACVERRGAESRDFGQGANICSKKTKGGEVDQFTISVRYCNQFPPRAPDAPARGQSTQTKRSSKLAENSLEPSAESFRCGRGQRAQSVKMSPRVVVPLSDRKLPRVFKVRGEAGAAARGRCGWLGEQLEQLGAEAVQSPFLVPF